MLDRYLIEHCSPTLASLKAGSLFSCKCTSEDAPEQWIAEWNEALRSRGLSLRLMRRTDSSALIYIFRKSALEKTLGNREISEFLRSFGYEGCELCEGCTADSCHLENCLKHLEDRINKISGCSDMSFPHEIGLFLGYPLADVKGFIRHKGRSCKHIGTWKVYGDVLSAKKTFAKFSKCSDMYNKLWKSGRRSIMQLTVAG